MAEINSAIDANGSSITDKLASLDSDFNTNKGFGLMGMMQANEEKLKAEIETPKEEPKEESNDSKEPPEWFGPLNTSLQAIRGETQQGLGYLANELNQLKSARHAETQIPPDVAPELVPVVQKFSDVDRTLGNLALRQEQQRAKDALRDARNKYKEFNYTDEELNQTWNGYVGNNPNKAAAINWDDYFKTQYESRVNPKLSAENEKLKAEVERLKSTRNSVQDLYSVPRSNRQSNSISTKDKDSDFDEELYQRAKSKLQKGRFMGFNRALLDEQRKMALSA